MLPNEIPPGPLTPKTAAALTELLRLVRGLMQFSASPPLNLEMGPVPSLRLDLPDPGFYARLGSEGLAPFSFAEVEPDGLGSWTTKVGGRTGSPSVNPAYEDNDFEDIPEDRIVWMREHYLDSGTGRSYTFSAPSAAASVGDLDGELFYRSDCINGRVWRYQREFRIVNGEASLTDWEFDSFQGCCDCSGSTDPVVTDCCEVPEILCLAVYDAYGTLAETFYLAYDSVAGRWSGSGSVYIGEPFNCTDTFTASLECTITSHLEFVFSVNGVECYTANFDTFCSTLDSGYLLLSCTDCVSAGAAWTIRVYDCDNVSGSVSGSLPDSPDDDCGGAESEGGTIPDVLTVTLSNVTGSCVSCGFSPATITYNPATYRWEGSFSSACGSTGTIQFWSSAGAWHFDVSGSGACNIEFTTGAFDVECDPFVLSVTNIAISACCTGNADITING